MGFAVVIAFLTLFLLGFPPYALLVNNIVRHYWGHFIHAGLSWRFGPLGKMGDELAASFARGMRADDKLYLPDPVYQGGTVERTRGSDWLAGAVVERERQAVHIPERAAIGEALLAEAREGDRILIMGARDDSLSELAKELVERLAARN